MNDYCKRQIFELTSTFPEIPPSELSRLLKTLNEWGCLSIEGFALSNGFIEMINAPTE